MEVDVLARKLLIFFIYDPTFNHYQENSRRFLIYPSSAQQGLSNYITYWSNDHSWSPKESTFFGQHQAIGKIAGNSQKLLSALNLFAGTSHSPFQKDTPDCTQRLHGDEKRSHQAALLKIWGEAHPTGSIRLSNLVSSYKRHLQVIEVGAGL